MPIVLRLRNPDLQGRPVRPFPCLATRRPLLRPRGRCLCDGKRWAGILVIPVRVDPEHVAPGGTVWGALCSEAPGKLGLPSHGSPRRGGHLQKCRCPVLAPHRARPAALFGQASPTPLGLGSAFPQLKWMSGEGAMAARFWDVTPRRSRAVPCAGPENGGVSLSCLGGWGAGLGLGEAPSDSCRPHSETGCKSWF